MTACEGDVAIVVGTLNRLDQLKTLVASVRRTVRTPWSLHVSDAGSDDGTRDWLTRERDADRRLHVTFEERRSGQAAALNMVFRQLTSRFACWVSDDNVLVGDGLDMAVAALSSDRGLGMVGLKVRDVRGPFAGSAYVGGVTSTGIINVNQGVLPTALLQDLKGFDENFRDYGIDADLTTRVLLAGRDVALTRAVAIEHHRNWPETGTQEARRMDERNAAYRARYDTLHSTHWRPDAAWLCCRALWKTARLLAPQRFDVNQARQTLGLSPRDWQNLLAARFVRLGSEWRDVGSPIHLRQHAPKMVGRDALLGGRQ